MADRDPSLPLSPPGQGGSLNVVESKLGYSPKFGCLIGIIGALVFTLLGIYFVHTGYRQNKAISQFTVEDPVVFQTQYSSPEAIESLRARLKAFGEDVDNGKSVALRLSAQDLNDLLGHEDMLFEIRGMLEFTDISGTVNARLSMPMRRFPPGKYRYLNGRIRFIPVVREGVLLLEVKEIDSDRGTVPGEFVKSFSNNTNLLHPYKEDKRLGPIIERIKEVRLENGNVVLRSR